MHKDYAWKLPCNNCKQQFLCNLRNSFPIALTSTPAPCTRLLRTHQLPARLQFRYLQPPYVSYPTVSRQRNYPILLFRLVSTIPNDF